MHSFISLSSQSSGMRHLHFSKRQADQWDHRTNRMQHANPANQTKFNEKQLYDQQSQTHALMPIVSIAGNPTIVEFSTFTHHITVICHNKMTSSKRTSESERTPFIQRMKGKHNRLEICYLCVKMGRLLTMGNTIYSLSQGRGLSL